MVIKMAFRGKDERLQALLNVIVQLHYMVPRTMMQSSLNS